MGDTEESGSLFNHIVGDMKTTGPLWEDFLVKASKFYAAVKQTAVTADTFLDSFQKIADANTNSKGATKDIGVSFTKIVMRHRAIEHKLKTYVGILADSFVTPLQDCIDDWKKTTSQLEKDHAKDYKKLKGDLKKASADAAKLKKKASKKIGKQEYTDQYRDAQKVANHICKTLEEQEKSYLRKVMIEERSRAAQFFKCYKPCVEQEITLIAEIEQLQSIVEETAKQCAHPAQLPAMSEDAIEAYKVPESLNPDSRDSSTSSSPPGSPPIVKDRSLTMGQGNAQRAPLNRSQTLPSSYKNGIDPIPVSVPMPTFCQSPASISSQSSFSSSSSLEHSNAAPLYDANTVQEIDTLPPPPPDDLHGNESDDLQHSQNSSDMINIHKALKTRTSWSSIETTSDSSGIGSYNSLNSQNKLASTTTMQNYYQSSSDSDIIEQDYLSGCDISNVYPSYHSTKNDVGGFHQNYATDDMKYATIDRSHFRRNKIHTSSLRDPLKQRSNSLGEDGESFPVFPNYKMNLPKSKPNNAANRQAPPTKPSVFQVFDGQNPQDLLKQLSPTSSPYKKAPPPAPHRRNSSPVGPQTLPKPNRFPKRNSNTVMSVAEIDEPEAARPGSFEAALQQRRMVMKKRSVSVDHSSSGYRY